jgi:catechol 2,3-dioxygenase-like lactoylglutathione lyase family enzyme
VSPSGQNPSHPSVRGILETSLYVNDLQRSAQFYGNLFGFEPLIMDDRLCALSVGNGQVLLLFRKGASRRPGTTAGGTIPPHDGRGEMHVAFAIESSDLSRWEEELMSLHIGIESRVAWPEGGTSIYFRDPDNHSIELASPGTWTIY